MHMSRHSLDLCHNKNCVQKEKNTKMTTIVAIIILCKIIVIINLTFMHHDENVIKFSLTKQNRTRLTNYDKI